MTGKSTLNAWKEVIALVVVMLAGIYYLGEMAGAIEDDIAELRGYFVNHLEEHPK